MPELLVILIVGAIAGWLAGMIVDSDSQSLLLDIVIGIVGGYVGFRLFGDRLDITSNMWINKILTATAGAVILALIIKLIRRISSPR